VVHCSPTEYVQQKRRELALGMQELTNR